MKVRRTKKGDDPGQSGPAAPSRNTMNPASVTFACSDMSCFVTITTSVWVRQHDARLDCPAPHANNIRAGWRK